MAIVHDRPLRRHPHAPTASRRDAGIDLIRAVCVAGVIVLHALMVGVTVGADGPSFFNAAEGTAWIAPLTLLVPLMPMFFVIGGFSGLVGYRRLRERGGTAIGFIAARVHRLLVPAVIAIALAGVGLAALAAGGIPPELIVIAGFRYSQPLWFLAVFLGCQALLPALAAAHERAGMPMILGLSGAATLVDVVRGITGIEAIGILNLVFVWLTLQQLGFFLADGRIDALSRRMRTLGVLGAVTLLTAGMVSGVYSTDLIVNQTPPTVVLILAGVALTGAFSLLRAPITAFSARGRVARFIAFVTPRAMTIYFWHMPVLLTMAGASALFASSGLIALPEPSSTGWWLTRPLWILAALFATAAVARVLAGAEGRQLPVATTSVARAAAAVTAGTAGIVLLLVAGTTVVTAAVATGLLLVALTLVSAGRSKMRDLCRRCRFEIQTKKNCPPIRPRMIRSGAGEMPRMSNGAWLVATHTPHELKMRHPDQTQTSSD